VIFNTNSIPQLDVIGIAKSIEGNMTKSTTEDFSIKKLLEIILFY
jgi:hypothetical protein